MAKKKTVSKKKSAPKPKVSKRGSSRFRKVQGILSDYVKSSGIKLGKGFNKAAGEIYRKSKDVPPKFIADNIEQLYKQFGSTAGPIQIPFEFKDNIPFYNFLDTLQGLEYDNAKISIEMSEGMAENADYAIEGDVMEVSEYYRENIYKYLRKNYNESPVAILKITDTDNKTFVDYVIIGGDVQEEPEDDDEETEDTEGGGPGPDQPTGPTGDKDIELIKEKQKLAEIEKEIEQAKAKTAEAENKKLILELFRDKLITKEEMLSLLKP